MASWEENVRKAVPYTPGEQPKIANIIKLNTNENPYPPSPAVLKALRGTDVEYLRRYPDPKSFDLTEAFARLNGISPDRVFAGVGSDDVLAMSFLTFFNSDRPVLFPDITYSFYDVWADLFRIPYRTVPLDENFRIVKEDYYGENGGIVIANPNAPTGIAMKQSDLRDIIDRNRDVVVIVDEAYIDFGGESLLGLTAEYENLLVVQTLSKSRALAGMRIGFAAGSEKLIRYLNDVKYSFNSYTMNDSAIRAGAAALDDREYFEYTRGRIIATRERSKKEMEKLGFIVTDSRSNFLFVRHKEAAARDIFHALRQAGIIVRYFDKPRIDNYLRITVGTDEQMDTLFAFLASWLKKEKA
jgi:histidinol-phosphate aminotransferase